MKEFLREVFIILLLFIPPPLSEASREVANLNEIKNPHTAAVYGVKEFVCLYVLSVCLSVCLLQTLTTNFLGLAKQNGLKFCLVIKLETQYNDQINPIFFNCLKPYHLGP